MRHFSQGAIQSTSGPLDAAIQGDGFFVIKTVGGATEYTRGGNFQVNSDGNLITATGEELQGWTMIAGNLNTNTPVGPITVPVGSLAPPRITTIASADVNLDASAAFGSKAGSFSTSVEVFDSLGTSHIVTFNFTKTAVANQWSYSAGIPPGDSTPPAVPVAGTLTFNANGQLTSPAWNAVQPVIAGGTLNDGAGPLNITWNLYDGQTPRLSQFAQTSATSAIAQNGAAAANLASVGLSDGGKILAQYSNGQQVVVGQLAMATVRNPESLIAVGNSNYQTSALTALPAVGLPGTGGRGEVLGGSIEASTVDIAKEFTNLIVFQRGYEANAHVITTVDQLSQDTINLKQ
jgi:flagellar hook protein FlgE